MYLCFSQKNIIENYQVIIFPFFETLILHRFNLKISLIIDSLQSFSLLLLQFYKVLNEKNAKRVVNASSIEY